MHKHQGSFKNVNGSVDQRMGHFLAANLGREGHRNEGAQGIAIVRCGVPPVVAYPASNGTKACSFPASVSKLVRKEHSVAAIKVDVNNARPPYELKR